MKEKERGFGQGGRADFIEGAREGRKIMAKRGQARARPVTQLLPRLGGVEWDDRLGCFEIESNLGSH